MLKTADKLPQYHSISYRGLPIIVEWPKGSTRTGEDKEGNPWKREMKADYGFVNNTTAVGDREPLDVYIGPNPDAEYAYVVEQLDEQGNLDEYKCVLGVDSLEEAEEMYLAHYPEDWEDTRLGEIAEIPFDYLFDTVAEHQETKTDKQAAHAWSHPNKMKELYRVNPDMIDTLVFEYRPFDEVNGRMEIKNAEGTIVGYVDYMVVLDGAFQISRTELIPELKGHGVKYEAVKKLEKILDKKFLTRGKDTVFRDDSDPKNVKRQPKISSLWTIYAQAIENLRKARWQRQPIITDPETRKAWESAGQGENETHYVQEAMKRLAPGKSINQLWTLPNRNEVIALAQQLKAEAKSK